MEVIVKLETVESFSDVVDLDECAACKQVMCKSIHVNWVKLIRSI